MVWGIGCIVVMVHCNIQSAFWLLAALVEDTLYQGTNGRDLAGCQVSWS